MPHLLWLAVLVILIVLLVGALPHWSYWGGTPRLGYAPSGAVFVVIIVLLILYLLGYF